MTMPVVTAMTPADLDQVMLLERQCFRDPWTRRMYLMDLTQNELATYLVVRPAESRWQAAEVGVSSPALSAEPSAIGDPAAPILAYGGFWLMVDEAHIATIASHPDWRGCGLGLWLMLALLDAASQRGAICSTLEVREHNLPAQRLYAKLGYRVTAMRKGYYRDGENGLIMTSPPLADPIERQHLAAARADALHKMARCFDPTEAMPLRVW